MGIATALGAAVSGEAEALEVGGLGAAPAVAVGSDAVSDAAELGVRPGVGGSRVPHQWQVRSLAGMG